MKIKEVDEIANLMMNLQENINEYHFSQDQIQNKLERLINFLEKSEKEIYTAFFKAELAYKKKNQYNTRKIQKYRKQRKIGYQILDDLIKEKATLSKPKLEPNLVRTIEDLRTSIQEINYKINVFDKQIQDTNLEISEENSIIESIEKLTKEKDLKAKRLIRLEQTTSKSLENSEYHTIQNLIEILEERIDDINANLVQFLHNRRSNHKDFLNLYRSIKSYEAIKLKFERNFDTQINFFKHYHKTFNLIRDYDKQKLLNEIYSTKTPKKRPKKKLSKKVRLIIKKKKLLKKLKDEKLKEALIKKKSGEKLDFYELKLIMDQLKKEK